MKEIKHTPGPWIVADTITNGNIGYEIHFNGNGECVTDHVYELADAKLIAAAPELLVSLRKAEDYITRSLTLSGKLSEKEIEIIIGHARQAIKKATE